MADLCLGTVQLGMKYGINNKVGKPNEKATGNILNTAFLNGIDTFDTASAYGEAEKLIGNFLAENNEYRKRAKIVTKQGRPVDGLSRTEIETVMREELENSLHRLKCEVIDTYLLHSYGKDTDSIRLEILQMLKGEGLIKKIGVSVYKVEEAQRAMDYAEIDCLQMPCSIFDQRGLQTGFFQKAKKNGIQIFARSAFLQGLLMMDIEEVPDHLSEIKPYLETLNSLLEEYSLEKRHAIIKFILDEQRIDYLVFGVETEKQLLEILAEKERKSLPKEFTEEIRRAFEYIPEHLILPIHWGK